MSSRNNPARVAIVMGSKSDWATMQFAAEIFEILNVPHHVEVVSAHRTPDKLFSFAESAEENGYQVIIAGAGGAAHLPGMIAAKTLVPVQGRGGDIEVRGFVTAPVNGRGSRSMQVFFVNGRFIKSQLLTAALEEGYRNQLLKGRFPGLSLIHI